MVFNEFSIEFTKLVGEISALRVVMLAWTKNCHEQGQQSREWVEVCIECLDRCFKTLHPMVSSAPATFAEIVSVSA